MLNANCLIVKTSSEIFLKSERVQRFFLKKLRMHINSAFEKNNVSVERIEGGRGRIFIYSNDLEKAQAVLSKMFGVHSTALAFQADSADFSVLEKEVLNKAESVLAGKKTFAIRVNRVSKIHPESRDVERKIGAMVLEKIPLVKVDLENPDATIFIELHDKEFFIYSGEKPSLMGLPIGVEGSIAFFFEGHQNELAAAFLLLKRGCNLFPVVKKKSPELEAHINKLVPFNAFREFALTEQQFLGSLVKERKISAIGYAVDCIEEIPDSHGLLCLCPLLLFPEEKKKQLLELIS